MPPKKMRGWLRCFSLIRWLRLKLMCQKYDSTEKRIYLNELMSVASNALKWTPFVGPRTVGIKVEKRLLFPFSSSSKPFGRFLLLFLLYCGYVGNAFALSKRSGISTGLAAASILSMPARHTAIGIWLFMA